MKKYWLAAFIMLYAIGSQAQNDLGNADDAARIAMTAYVDSDLGFNREVSKQLLNKMNTVLTMQSSRSKGWPVVKISVLS